MTGMNLPRILQDDEPTHQEAVDRLRDYCFSTRLLPAKSGAHANPLTLPYFTGSRFESFRQQPGTENEITASDLLSLSLLSVPIKADATLIVIEERRSRITELLQELPTDKDLGELDEETFCSMLGAERKAGSASPGQELWDLLRGNGLDGRIGMGPVRVSKLLARKRPRLLPIYDTLVATAFDLRDSLGYWKEFHSIMRPEVGLADRLSRIRTEAGVVESDTSLLRVMDILVWHAQKYTDETWRDRVLSTP